MPDYEDEIGTDVYATMDMKPDRMSLQFWLNKRQNFYCKFEKCGRVNSEGIKYNCKDVRCECIAGMPLCDLDGIIDLTEILREIQGPGFFECKGNECLLSEPILDSFFEGGLMSTCQHGECLRPSQIPGFELPPSQPNYLAIMASSLSLLAILVTLGFFMYRSVRRQGRSFQGLDYASEETQKLLDSHVPSHLLFKDIGYILKGQVLVNNVSGSVSPGQLLAIIGPSGSGKTTTLELLAKKMRKGDMKGEVYVNGDIQDMKSMKFLSGFVDQEDILLGTLTVRETLMYSAMLRLPPSMSYEAKKLRVQQTMDELDISSIADRLIGVPGKRGISGGEKRRVTIAQELVTSPSILFLDEPTSGLDSHSAYLVVCTLSRLAKDFNRTVIFSIHQPRSNIFSLFDKLLVLSNGRMLYSGEAKNAKEHFAHVAECPEGYNTADYIIDLTMTCDLETFKYSVEMPEQHEEGISLTNSSDKLPFVDQVFILSQRTVVNLYRNPLLLLAHYATSIIIAFFCGALYWQVKNDMGGVQNRLGCIFFILAFFAFSSMSSLEVQFFNFSSLVQRDFCLKGNAVMVFMTVLVISSRKSYLT